MAENQYAQNRYGDKPVYDDWLDKYVSILCASGGTPILDLGCGSGNDSLYLSERGYGVISCDISEQKLTSVRRHVPGAVCMLVDLRAPLPFEDQRFHVVVADLSLHYFSWHDTVRTVGEIRCILKTGGVLLCRVNSTEDVRYGAGQGVLIEDNYYLINGKTKRFFDRGQLEELFSDWDVLNMCDYQMDRYEHPKLLWEAAVKKRGK